MTRTIQAELERTQVTNELTQRLFAKNIDELVPPTSKLTPYIDLLIKIAQHPEATPEDLKALLKSTHRYVTRTALIHKNLRLEDFKAHLKQETDKYELARFCAYPHIDQESIEYLFTLTKILHREQSGDVIADRLLRHDHLSADQMVDMVKNSLGFSHSIKFLAKNPKLTPSHIDELISQCNYKTSRASLMYRQELALGLLYNPNTTSAQKERLLNSDYDYRAYTVRRSFFLLDSTFPELIPLNDINPESFAKRSIWNLVVAVIRETHKDLKPSAQSTKPESIRKDNFNLTLRADLIDYLLKGHQDPTIQLNEYKHLIRFLKADIQETNYEALTLLTPNDPKITPKALLSTKKEIIQGYLRQELESPKPIKKRLTHYYKVLREIDAILSSSKDPKHILDSLL
jgi:hypothetical protein